MNTPSTSLAHPATARAEYNRFLAFAKRPVLPVHDPDADGAVRATFRMLWLDLAVMATLIAALGAAAAMGFELPDNVNNTLEPGWQTIVLIVVLAPVLEEIAFRSWLTGRPAIIAVVAVLVIGLAAVPAIISFGLEGSQPTMGASIAMMASFALAIVGAPLVGLALLKRPTPNLFRRTFPLFFWASTLAFALVHLLNYTEGSLAVLLPLVLPQFVLGAMLGYLRVHHGLVPAIALHAFHNGILFSLAMLGQTMA